MWQIIGKHNKQLRPKATAIGTFDGVHLGHIEVLATLKKVAAQNGLDPIVITFDRHPLAVIAPERMPKAITTVQRKESLLRKAGVRPMVLPFNENLRRTTARDWMAQLAHEYGVKALVVGYDNTFGSDGLSLSIADYRKIGKEFGIDVIEAPLVAGVSSSAVRKAIAAGDITTANDMLGRHFMLPGKVVDGNKLGRTIGVPTANVMPEPGIAIPGRGVYAAKVILPDGTTHPAMVNIGIRPTISRGNLPTVEAHILNWDGDLYGKEINIMFYSRLRDEQKFDSIDSLRLQLEADKTATLKAL